MNRSICSFLVFLGCLSLSAGSQARKQKLDEAISFAVAAEYELALELFKDELRRNPKDPLLNYYVGITCYKLDQLSEAIAHFESAIEHNAKFPQVFFWATKAYLSKEMPEEAVKTLQLGRMKFPRNKDLNDLAESLDELLDTDSSERLF